MNNLTEKERLLLGNEYGLNKSLEGVGNSFLGKVMRNIRKFRPHVELKRAYTLYHIGIMTQLWIQTPPCGNSQAGCCTVCNYWRGWKQTDVVEQIVRDVILPDSCDTLLVNTCGSCLDSRELPTDMQDKLLKWISGLSCRRVILETHADTLTDDNIRRVRHFLPDQEVFYEFGLESLSDTILYYCYNKPKPKCDLRELVERVHRVGARCIVNVLLGAPFLTRQEQIEDAVASLLCLLENSVDFIVLFPVNIKPYTLPYILHKYHRYNTIRGDMIVDVLSRIPEESLNRVDVAWYGEHTEDGVIAPGYCPVCQPDLRELIELYNRAPQNPERQKLLARMKVQRCTCGRYNDEAVNLSLYERLFSGYAFLRQSVFNGNGESGGV